jgi:hypothetical protein
MAEPPLTLNAIAGVINDANLDPSDAMRDLGYNPIGVRAGFARGLAGGRAGRGATVDHAAAQAHVVGDAVPQADPGHAVPQAQSK